MITKTSLLISILDDYDYEGQKNVAQIDIFTLKDFEFFVVKKLPKCSLNYRRVLLFPYGGYRIFNSGRWIILILYSNFQCYLIWKNVLFFYL